MFSVEVTITTYLGAVNKKINKNNKLAANQRCKKKRKSKGTGMKNIIAREILTIVVVRRRG